MDFGTSSLFKAFTSVDCVLAWGVRDGRRVIARVLEHLLVDVVKAAS